MDLFGVLKRGLNLFVSSPTRLLRFSLNNTLRPYLKDEVDQDAFEVQLWKGIVCIDNVELNEQVLNKKLNGLVPFSILGVRIGKLTMDIPWRKVATDNVKVILENVVVRLSLSEEPPLPHQDDHLERSLEKALEHSIILEKEATEEERAEAAEERDDNLGIQSIEELFDNIFSQMNVTFRNVVVHVENREHTISLTIRDMTFGSAAPDTSKAQSGGSATFKAAAPPSKSAQSSKKEKSERNNKVANIQGVSLDIQAPANVKGTILSFLDNIQMFIRYGKNSDGNLVDMEIDAQLLQGKFQAVLSTQQLAFLKEFLRTSRFGAASDAANSENEFGQSDMDGRTYPSDETDSEEMAHLNALQRSIMTLSAYGPPIQTMKSSEPLNFCFKLLVKRGIFALKDSDTFALDAEDLQFTYEKRGSGNCFGVSIVNLSLVQVFDQGSQVIATLTSLQENKHRTIPKLKIGMQISNRAEQQVLDVRVEMQSLTVVWRSESFQKLSKLLQQTESAMQDEQEINIKDRTSPVRTTTRSAAPMFTLRSPRLNFSVQFPRQDRSIMFSLDVKGLRLSNRPSTSDKMAVWFVEFEDLATFVFAKEGTASKPHMMRIWTNDPHDRPRLEITFQKETESYPPSAKSSPRPIPSMMFNLEAIFQNPRLVSFYSKSYLAFPYASERAINFEQIKQTSNLIVEAILPCVQLELELAEYSILKSVLAEISGESNSSSASIISIGKGSAILSAGNRTTEQSAEEYRIEVDEFKIFQGVICKNGKTGSFTFLTANDAKVIDPDNAVLLRKTPRQLKMDEVFCPPFAISARKLETLISNNLLVLEEMTLGTKWFSWKRFISVLPFFGSDEPEESRENDPESENSETQISVEGLSLYYQPTMAPIDALASMFSVLPRAVVSLSTLKVVIATNFFTISGKELKLWLKEDFHYLKNSEIWLDLCHPSLASHLLSKCLVPVVHIDSFGIDRESKGDFSEVNVHFQDDQPAQPLNEDEQPSNVRITVRADSYETLLRVVSSMSQDFTKETTAPEPKVPEKKKKKVASDKNSKSEEIPATFRRTTSEEQPIPSKPKRIVSRNSGSQSPGAAATVLFDEIGDAPNEPANVPNVAYDMAAAIQEEYFSEGNGPLEEQWEWVNDENEQKLKEKEEEERVFPSSLVKVTTTTFHNVMLSWRMLGGRDWDTSHVVSDTKDVEYQFEEVTPHRNRAIDGHSDSVELILEVPSIIIDTFAADQKGDWRLRVEVRKLVVDDHVKASHHAKVLTFSRQDTKRTGKTVPPSIFILYESGKYQPEDSSPSHKLKVVIQPIRFYVDQDTLSFLSGFFTYSSSVKENPKPTKLPPKKGNGMLFEYFDLSAIDTMIDYKPRNTIGEVYSDIRLGNNIWAFKLVELNKAPITLSAIKLRKVKNKDELIEGMLSVWIKDFKQTQVYNYLYGTRIGQPVQIAVNIGSGVVDLIKAPADEYYRGGNILKGIGLGATSLVQRVTVELLNLGASSAITIKKGLTGIDKALTGRHSSRDLEHISNYANQPENMSQAAQRAVTSITSGFSNSLSSISKGGIRNISSGILQLPIGGISALSNLTLGLRNTVDKTELQNSKEKYKYPSNSNS
eukprot:TRINITY_DN2049_c0_g1_i1.p1 TRINITY_DN2049_c0_g1~~TRINITY_DN2049_c0_g1_i1.p1  ORF type:complete len:1600 (+),score=467.39 TRINITY_DN2049_c0_g1_i1:193-4992(+)